MAEILSVDDGASFDESIGQYEYHTHAPHASTRYESNDEIPIAIQQQYVFTLPAESYLHIDGRLQKNDNVTAATALNFKLVNNAVAFLFDEIRYEVAGVEVDNEERGRDDHGENIAVSISGARHD